MANTNICWIITSISPPPKKLSLREMGFRFIMRLSDSSLARASPGMPSPSTLIMSSISGVKGSSQPINCANSITSISDMLHTSKKYTSLRMFENMFLPSATASIMVENLSSVRIILAALLETSVPFMPIATPTSAAFNAGASFTPSPVIATTSPRDCQAFTMRILSSGLTRAYTE